MDSQRKIRLSITSTRRSFRNAASSWRGPKLTCMPLQLRDREQQRNTKICRPQHTQSKSDIREFHPEAHDIYSFFFANTEAPVFLLMCLSTEELCNADECFYIHCMHNPVTELCSFWHLLTTVISANLTSSFHVIFQMYLVYK